MTDAARVWHEAAQLAAAGVDAALATVARRRGSLPMASDAKMLVTAEGRCAGTVGGGCVEAEVVHQALATLATRRPAFARHTLNADLAGDLGLSCGGTVELFLEPFAPHPALAEFCDAVAGAMGRRVDLTLVTRTSWTDGPAKLAQLGDEVVGVGDAPAPIPAAAFPRGAVQVDDARHLVIERIGRAPRVVIFGAGHVGAAIAALASRVGFHVLVADDREEFANPDNLPGAHEVVCEDLPGVLERLRFENDDCVLATTRGHAFDANVVERAAPSLAGYVGMLGSRRKQVVVRNALVRAGVPADALARVRTPIGLEIGAETPAEIAVSVVAELVAWRRGAETSEERDEGVSGEVSPSRDDEPPAPGLGVDR